MLPDKPLLTRVEAANFLTKRGHPIVPETLANMAAQGGGPSFYKGPSRVLYDPEELERWRKDRFWRVERWSPSKVDGTT